MVSTILTIIIIIGITSRFYLKFTPMKSFAAFMSAIIGFITALSFYEVLASFLISRGYFAQWVQALVFLLIFFAVTFILENVSDYVVGSNVDFGKPVKITTAIICGLLTSLIISGTVDIAFALAPMGKSAPYSRFGDTINPTNPSSALIPADGFVAGFYNLIANGALGTGNNFDVVHANFLDQIHMNRYAVKEGAAIVAAEDAAYVEKYGVRRKELSTGETRIVIELNIKSGIIKKGGAKDGKNKVSFSMAQTRLICAPAGQSELTGKNIKILYPEKYFRKGQPVKEAFKLSEVIEFDNKSLIKAPGGQVAKIDLAFNVPENLTPKLLQFKANTVIQLPKLVTQEEIDAAAEEAANNPTTEDNPEN